MDFEDDETFMLHTLFMLCVFMYHTASVSEINRRWWVRPIFEKRNEKGAFLNLFSYMKTRDPEMFFKYTRMHPNQFDHLLGLLKRKLQKRSRREYLSPEFRLAMTLKYLAHGGSFQSLSWEFRVGQSTVSKLIFETSEAIWDVLCPVYLKTPTENDWLSISSQFLNTWNFPHTLGAIDGKHVQIQCPRNSGSQFYNYKNHFSIVLLACCDAEYKFTWVDIGAYGSEHDAGIFRRSEIERKINNGVIALPKPAKLHGSDIEMPYYFVGDEAFPLKPYIMRPYPGKYLSEQKSVFNYRLSRARRVIENAFGILASRFRIYRSPLLCSLKTIEALVKATICLHNYLRTESPNLYTPPTLMDSIRNGEIVEGEWREMTKNDSNLTAVGRTGCNTAAQKTIELREKLAEYLTSDAGAVPWQLAHINRGRF